MPINLISTIHKLLFTLTDSFIWKKNGSFLSVDQQITGLSAGTYTLVVTDLDNAGGSQEVSYLLTQPASPLSATYSLTNVTCFGANNGSITITASGGTAFASPTQPYSYEWKRGTTTLTSSTSNVIQNLEPDINYSCTITSKLIIFGSCSGNHNYFFT